MIIGYTDLWRNKINIYLGMAQPTLVSLCLHRLLISESISSTVFKVKTAWEKSTYYGLAVSHLYRWVSRHGCCPACPSFTPTNSGLGSWLEPGNWPAHAMFGPGVSLTSAAPYSRCKTPSPLRTGCKSEAETTLAATGRVLEGSLSPQEKPCCRFSSPTVKAQRHLLSQPWLLWRGRICVPLPS